jgi:hypothetical protein
MQVDRGARAASGERTICFDLPNGDTAAETDHEKTMTDQNSFDANSNEGLIARARRRAHELAEGSLISAGREAERRIQCLGREPCDEELILIEHIAILDVRTRMLRKWGKQKEADAATLILSKLLSDLHKMRPRLRP